MFLRSLLQASALLPFLYTTVSAQTACNNSPSLCSKAYNNITYLGAHDSPFLRDESTSFSTAGNQFYDSTTQLDAGVRLLSAQVHKVSSQTGAAQWRLCHGDCDFLDAGTLEDWLKEIKTWMDANTNDVVTILLVNSDNAPASTLGPFFNSSGISEYAYSPPTAGTIPDTWPTLQSLISNGTRLMTFVASLTPPSTEYPFLMDEFTYIFENDYENEGPTEYSCNPNRPTTLTSTSEAASSGRMFLQNHFLYANQLGIQTPNVTYVNTTNAQTGLGALGVALGNCTAVYGKSANFVLVDFFNVGPAIASVDAANGVSGATGRKSVSAEVPNETESGVGRREGNLLAVVVAVFVAVALGM
ncbi:hypothetical protein K458DRAFT_446918 [Lentithecium fluviatile CBS 122367]|uniref:PLC-like phosphodiesterase n=1 Tax=Lentithecium fluviatile CBS 122367 TaxID=1168545 RepID=A0A6G1IH85_9PLEO|nr:hypothetical protein K458DRAFT_446918 [Lentithecium fluviatile CBS 122367]